jgi:hypothetical protein
VVLKEELFQHRIFCGVLLYFHVFDMVHIMCAGNTIQNIYPLEEGVWVGSLVTSMAASEADP